MDFELSDELYSDTVTFKPAVYATGTHGGSQPSYPTGKTIANAYVEITISGSSHLDASDSKPLTRATHRIFTQVNPSAGLSRELQIDDLAIWDDDGISLQILTPPRRQGVQWVTECERVK